MMKKRESPISKPPSERITWARHPIRLMTACMAALALTIAAMAQAQNKKGKVLSVSDAYLEIDRGYLDGLETGNEGTVFFEIIVTGEKRKVSLAKFKIVDVYGTKSRAEVVDKTGEIRAGYSVDLDIPDSHTSLDYLLQQANARFARGDYHGAQEFYTRINEIIPGDPLASQRIADCNAGIAAQKEREKELQNISYYRSAMQALLKEKNFSQAGLYARKILSIYPEDEASKEVLNKIRDETAENKAKTELMQRAAKSEAVKTARANKGPWDGMVYIPGGEVILGEDAKKAEYYNEQPAHVAKLKPFYIDKYEVTNAQYKKFIEATGSLPPPHWRKGEFPPEQANFPVVNITWDEAAAYAKWAGKRLPTEAEWELAARGRDQRKWPWGNKGSKSFANTLESKLKAPAAVGRFAADVSPFGVYDTGGNVSEWTADWYLAYPGNDHPEKDYGKAHKALRGGSFNTPNHFARCAFRAHLPRDFRAWDLGFRCARDVPAEKSE